MMAHYVDPDRQRNFAAIHRLSHYMAVPPIMNGRYKLVHCESSGSMVQYLTCDRRAQVPASPASLRCVLEQEH